LSSGQQTIVNHAPRQKDASLQLNARVVIADDHDIVREGIRRILTQLRPNWETCGEAGDDEESAKLVNALKPNVVVLDITMPGISGLEAARRITELKLGCRILIFTVHDSDWLRSEIRAANAHGYVHKSQVARDLVTAIECLLAGGTFFTDQIDEERAANSIPQPSSTTKENATES
jgi:two-component system invasion response regulator UvrY